MDFMMRLYVGREQPRLTAKISRRRMGFLPNVFIGRALPKPLKYSTLPILRKKNGRSQSSGRLNIFGSSPGYQSDIMD
jgi:hypothetical protein